MPDIKGISKDFSASYLKHDEKTGRAGDGRKRAAIKESEPGAELQMNKLIVELNLNVKKESKDGLRTQAGIKAFQKSSNIDLSQIKYNDRPITELSPGEARELISEDGFLGVKKTSLRLADFAIQAAGDDVEKLKVARGAVLRGFKEAEESFGGSMPEISYETINRALELIDEKIRALGGAVVDIRV